MMKTACFYLAVLLCVVWATADVACAQKGSRLGLRVGPLITWTQTASPDPSVSSVSTGLERPGFALDMIYTLGFSDRIMLQTGLSFASKHASIYFTGEEDGDQMAVQLNSGMRTLEIPVGVKVRAAALRDDLHLIGHLGANVEYNLQSDYEVIVTRTPPTGPPTVLRDMFDYKEWLQPFVVALAPGAGLDWESDWGMLEFAATYQVGLTRYHRYYHSRTHAVVFGLGYFF